MLHLYQILRCISSQYVASVTFVCVVASFVYSQEIENDRPTYRVHVWVVPRDVPEVMQATGTQFNEQLTRTLELAFAGGCVVTVERAPRIIATSIQHDSGRSYDGQSGLSANDFQKWDKLFLLSIDWDGADYLLHVNEVDTRVQRWVGATEIKVPLANGLAEQAGNVISSTFSPVGTVGKPRDRTVKVKLHAGVFSQSLASPLVPRSDALMQVIIRRRRRSDKGTTYRLSAVPWTVLRVKDTALGVAECQIYSGLRSPLRVRGVGATDRMAVQIRPQFANTVLRLHARSQVDKPLVGYQVFAKDVDGGPSRYVGQTDWDGAITLPRDDAVMLKTYYIKHGKRLLARLPIVAGFEKEVAIGVEDDDDRLRAEGAVLGIQERLVDSMTRRQIYAARIRQRLEEDDLREPHIEQAKQLLGLLRESPDRTEFIREMQIQQRRFTSRNAAAQSRIDRLYRDTRDMITRNLDPELVKQLAGEIAKAEGRLEKLRTYQASRNRNGERDADTLENQR